MVTQSSDDKFLFRTPVKTIQKSGSSHKVVVVAIVAIIVFVIIGVAIGLVILRS